jgi:hypothetical protein
LLDALDEHGSDARVLRIVCGALRALASQSNVAWLQTDTLKKLAHATTQCGDPGVLKESIHRLHGAGSGAKNDRPARCAALRRARRAGGGGDASRSPGSGWRRRAKFARSSRATISREGLQQAK